MMSKSAIALFFILILGFASCGGDEEPMIQPTPSFDRGAMLAHWADNLIVPAFDEYVSKLDQLKNAKDAFVSNANETTYNELKGAWLEGYLAWQNVSIYDIGKAEEIGLRNFSNVYPTDVDLINRNIENQNYNLNLPSNFDAQGFPALDYLLFGLGDDDATIVDALSEANRLLYLNDVVEQLYEKGKSVADDWNGGYRDQFVNNNGSSATASVDKLVNDFLFYYEKFLRAGKIGIPAGVFSGSPISTSVEAPFSEVHSKVLFNAGMTTVKKFFKGESFIGSSNGLGLDDYLSDITERNGTGDIASSIENQWAMAETQVELLSDNFKQQVETNNSLMLQAFDELQKAVVLLKVDMLQALNIQVDFVDADGD